MFDVGQALGTVGIYLLGFIAIVLASSRSRKWAIVLVAYLAVPVLWIAVQANLKEHRNAEVMRESLEGETRNAAAFGNYCKSRKMTVDQTVPPLQASEASDADRTVSVQFDNAFPGLREHFHAGQVAISLQRRPTDCMRSGLAYIEGIYDGRVSPTGYGYEKEVRRFAACENTQPVVVPTVRARYQLVIGEQARKDAVPWGGEQGRWMSTSTIRLYDQRDKRLLAQDDIYFLRYESGVGGCPSAEAQVSELLLAVFAR